MADTKKKGLGLHITTGAVTAVFTVLGLVLFLLSFTTNYYIFGQMNSNIITTLIGGALLAEIAAVALVHFFPDALWTKLLTFIVTGLLAAAAMLIIGDRVEGIGNCIITDYDSGHGGEEAIYMSLVGSVSLIVAMIYNIIGAFSKDGNAPAGKAKTLGFTVSGAVLGLAAIIATLALVGIDLTGGTKVGPGGVTDGAGGDMISGTYTVSYNQNNGNAEDMPNYQFLCSSLEGMVRADARLFIDITLDLDGAGNYKLTSDSYVVEGGGRAVVGDDTGLGMVLNTTAEGTYTDNGGGNVTISRPTHAVFEMQTDTYSSQMKGAAQMNVNGNDADGVYDSNDEPAVLDFVPETTFKLADGAIITYGKGALSGTFTVSYNVNNGNAGDIPDYQFLCGKIGGMLEADSRFFIDETLTLDGAGNYTLFIDSYVVEGDKRAEIGDETGLGLILTTKAEGTYTDNGDGTVTTSVPTHAVFEMETDTYSSQLKGAMQLNVNGNDADGVYDSNDEPTVLDFVPETVWTLDSGNIVTYKLANEETEEQPGEEQQGTEPASGEGVTITSDDDATTMTFYPDGTYRFFFESYSVEDLGTYTYENGVLTTTNANGNTATAEGDPLHLHYVTSVSGQLAGDYTVPASTFDFATAPSSGPVTVLSDDEATSLTFNGDGTYVFAFPSYNIEDSGTYTYENGVLTVVNATGLEMTLENGHLHYVSGVSDMLTGEFTIDTAFFEGGAFTPAPASATVTSDDEGTTITFHSDGTYRFFFESYSVEDLGTYTYEGGILTLANANGDEFTADGDPMHLHYVTAVSDMLAGDYTIPADTFSFEISKPAAPNNPGAAEPGGDAPLAPAVSIEGYVYEAPVTVPSDDDGRTEMTFNPDGTYRFWFEEYTIEDLGTFTYENGVLTLTDQNGKQYTAEGDVMHLHYAYSLYEMLESDYTVPASIFVESESLSVFDAPVTLTSSGENATTMTFNADGTYLFAFTEYNIEDPGTYTFENGVLTLTDANGKEYVVEGNPMELSYAYSAYEMLTGNFSFPASIFAPSAAKDKKVGEFTVTGEDRPALLEFRLDGTYFFNYEQYGLEEEGRYSYSNGVLKLTNSKNVASTANGEGTLSLRYQTAISDMLAISYTIPAANFDTDAGAGGGGAVTIPSDDGSTKMIFNPDGTYQFRFDDYNIDDFGTYTYEGGVLTVTDANGKQYTAEGNPMHLHYAFSAYDILTGDYTIPAEAFN